MPRRKVNVIEVSLIAVAREHLSPPLRCLHKLTFCVQPRNAVTCQAAQITGLDNWELELCPPFREVAHMIEKFLYTLKQPICLIAHNGDKFDFPLLRAEFKHASPGIDLAAFFCCDSLPAFRDILGNADCHEVTELMELHKLGEDFWEAFDTPMSDEDELLSQPVLKPVDSTPQRRLSELRGSSPAPPPPKKICPGSVVTGNHSLLQHQPAARRQLFASGEDPRTANGKNGVPHTLSQNGSVTPCLGTAPPSFNGGSRSMNGKRSISFKLGSVYERVVRKEMSSAHEAEADCRALADICARLGRRFLEYVDAKHRMFDSVVPMW